MKIWLQRYGQFHLRSLFGVTTAVALAVGIFARTQAAERELLGLINRYNAAMDTRDDDAAEAIAKAAVERFPGNELAHYMLRQIRYVAASRRGEAEPEEPMCILASSSCDSFDFGDPAAWEEVTDRRRVRNRR